MIKREYQYILFDLDGTLTDSKPGIVRCVKETLAYYGIEEREEDLEKFIGPPLTDSFREFYHFDEEQIKEAVELYRGEYRDKGIFENEIYPGMKEFLSEMKQEGKILAVATSKPVDMAKKVLSYFEIESYFDYIVGSIPNTKRLTKIDVMKEVMREIFFPNISEEKIDTIDFNLIPRSEILMIGDRKFDILGANHFGVDSVGVTYGYAPEGELTEAGATYLAADIYALRKIILHRFQSKEDLLRNSFSKSLEMITPFALYWLIGALVTMLLAGFIGLVQKTGTEEWARTVRLYSMELSVLVNALAALATYPMSYFYYKKRKMQDESHIITRRNKKILKTLWPVLVIMGMSFAISLNLFMGYLNFFRTSAYGEVENVQYGVGLIYGLIVFGLITPVAEEAMFRGVLYNSVRRYFGSELAIVITAVVFGLYHGNLTQFVYATLMGLLLAFVYERFHKLEAPIIIHVVANCVVYVVSRVEMLNSLVSNVYALGIFAVLAVVSSALCVRYTKER